MKYYFRHTDIVDHPQILQAGFWGAQVFTAVCDVNAARDFGGEVPAAYLDPAWLARWMNLQPADVPGGDVAVTVGHALSRCFVTGLLIKTEAGATIDGWGRRQPKAPMTAAQRKRKQRESQEVSRNVTNDRDSHACHDRKGEEKRGEEKEATASQPAAVAAPPPPLELKPVVPEAAAPAEKPKRERKLSAQEALWGRMQIMRAEACPGAPPDPGLRPAALNAKLGELLDAGHFGAEAPLLEGYRAFLADERWARKLDPPCPLSAFVSQWAKYLSASQRRPAEVPRRTEGECEACGGRAEARIAGGVHWGCYACMAAWGETLARDRPGAKPFSQEAEEHFAQWAAQKRGRAA